MRKWPYFSPDLSPELTGSELFYLLLLLLFLGFYAFMTVQIDEDKCGGESADDKRRRWGGRSLYKGLTLEING